MSPLRIGILGAGGIASRHASNISHIEDATITCVCDAAPGKAESFSATHTAATATAYTDFQTMVAVEELDARHLTAPGPIDRQAEMVARHKHARALAPGRQLSQRRRGRCGQDEGQDQHPQCPHRAQSPTTE